MAVRILYPMAGDTVGGSHLTVLEITRALSRKSFEPVIALHAKGALAAGLDEYKDVSKIWFPRAFRDVILHPYRVVDSIRRARKFIRENNIGIVQCDDGPLRHIWFYAACLAGVPYVHYQQTIARPTPEKTLIYPLYDACVSCSKAAAESLPAGVSRDIAYPVIALETINRPVNSKKQIGFVANMRHQKRPGVFLQMAKIMKDAGVDARFFMAGDFYGNIENELRGFARAGGLEGHVEFLGFHKDAQALIAAADILVVPAVGDSFGRTLVEAMRLGTPVIAADSAGHREIIENGVTGFLAPPDDAQGFSARAQELLGNDILRMSIIQAARKSADEKFTAAQSLSVFENIYRRLAQ